jgi:hypothetical protein
MDGDTPTLMARTGYFDRLPSSLSASPMHLPNPFGTPTPPVTAPALSPKSTKPLQIKKKSKPAVDPVVEQGELQATGQELGSANKDVQGGMTESRTTGIIATPPVTPAKKPRKPVPSSPPAETSSPLNPLPFRIIKPSLPTLEKATSVALFFEAFYHSLLKPPQGSASASTSANYLLNRAKRMAALEESFNLLENRFMSEAERQFRRDELVREENHILRDRRSRVDAKAFEMGRVIGHGAFGVVRIAREKQGGRLVAMKQVSPGS